MKDIMNINNNALMMAVLVIVSFLSYNVKDYSKIIGIHKSLLKHRYCKNIYVL